jgi:DNA-binding FrmR family transcriptional regulator
MANDASMIFRIKGDASHVKKELSTLGVSASRTVGTLGKGLTGALQGNFSALSGGISSVGSGLSMLGPKGMIAAAGISAVAGAASAATAGLFALTKEAASYGSKISDLTDKTGLGAEALTSLDYAARISGSSIDEVAGGITKFSKLVGEAAQGSDEAVKKLERFGVTPQEAMTNLEGALGKVFKRIQSLPPGVQRTKAAMDAFGRSGANLLPMINTMNGDFEGLIAKAKELGLTFDDVAAQEMDRFDDMLNQVGMQFEGLKRQIGIAFLPMFMELATEVSNFLKENQDEIKQIAKDASGFFRVVLKGLKDVVDFVRENQWAWNLIKATFTPLAVGSALLSLGRSFNQVQPPSTPTASPGPTPGTIDDLYQNIAAEQAALQKRRRALDVYYKMDTEQARIHYEGILAQRLEMLKTGEQDEETFRGAFLEATDRFYNFLRNKIRQSLELQLQDEELSLLERRNLQRRAQIDIQKLNEEERASRKRTLDQIEAINRAIVQSDIDRVNRIYSAQMRFVQAAQAELRARFALLRAQGKATEGQELAVYYTKEIELIDLAIKQTNDLMNVQRLSQEQREQYAQELMILEAQRRALLDDIERVGIEGGKRIGEEAVRVTNERVALEQQIEDVVNRRIERGIEAEIRGLEKSLETAKNKTAVLQQIAALEEELELRRYQATIKRLEEEKDTAIRSITDKANELQIKADLEKLYREKELDAEEEFQLRLKQIRDRYSGQAEIGKTIGDEMKTIGDAMKKALGDIASGLGQAVSAWVLYGETGGAMMRKVVAESLAALAQLAVVKVLTNLAEGFEALAMMNPGKAAMHFTAAKIWGAVGVGSAVAGRLVAGDTFKRESGRDSVSGRQSNNTGTQGQGFSSMQEQTVDVNRAASFGAIQRETVVVVKDKSGMFSKLFQVEMEKNSKVRQTIMRTA